MWMRKAKSYLLTPAVHTWSLKIPRGMVFLHVWQKNCVCILSHHFLSILKTCFCFLCITGKDIHKSLQPTLYLVLGSIYSSAMPVLDSGYCYHYGGFSNFSACEIVTETEILIEFFLAELKHFCYFFCLNR